MSDTLERELAARLRDVGATVPVDLEPLPDLELRVARRRKRKGRVVGLSGLAVAASLLVAIGIIAVVEQAPANRKVGISSPGTTSTAVDVLNAMTMIDARDHFVVALDAGGHQQMTLVTAQRGVVVDAQLTADHRTLWYLSVDGKAGVDCGEVVRADVVSGRSEIVTHAVAFGISADGRLLAVSGQGACAPLPGRRLAVRDLVSGVVATTDYDGVSTDISWSPLGDRFVTTCTPECGKLQYFDVPEPLGGMLRAHALMEPGRVAFGADALYVASSSHVVRFDLTLLGTPTTVATTVEQLDQVIPTARGVYVVTRSRPDGPPDRLARVESGVLVPVRTFADGFGTLTPILP